MRFDAKGSIGVHLASLALLGLVAAGGLAQPPQPPQGPPAAPGNFRLAPVLQNQSVQDIAGMGSAPQYRSGFQPPALATPYYGTGIYAPYSSPYGGYLSGVADIYSSVGQTMISEQQANLLREKKKQAQIETRRMNFDESLYERDRAPTIEDDRERARIETIRRSRNNPPLNEIVSGIALNNLLLTIQQTQAQRGPGPSIPVDPDTVSRLNVTSGATTGSVGLLRDDGKLKWPLPLQAPAYGTDRNRMTELAPVALKQAATGQVQADTLDGMIESARNLDRLVSQNVADLTPKEYSQAKSYIRQLNGTIQALQDPSVADYLGKWVLKGNTVGEVIDQMTRQGLKFAPATSGGDAAYVAMHTSMVAYLVWDPSRPWDTLTK